MSQETDTPLRILSLDGGGIRGKSSLLILESIMEKIRQSEGLEETSKPCDRFDLIGGTSTGGIIAIMLGRLGMSVAECIDAYNRVGEVAFTPKLRFNFASPQGAYSATALETAIKEVVQTHCARPRCAEHRSRGRSTTNTCTHGDKRFRNSECTKTVVLAITKDNVDTSPTLFTTYDTAPAYNDCTIWQIARATSAATTFFKPIQLGRDKIDFVDAGFGYNNPCEVLIEEAKRQFPGREHLQILSIGTGLGNIVSIKDSRLSILKALKKMATTSTKVATRLDDRYGGGSNYYRFNVERGLEDITLADWQKTSQISSHTSNYLRENRRALDAFVHSFLARPQVEQAGTAGPDEPPSSRSHYYLPFEENKHFVRRVGYLDALVEKLFQKRRREVALVGLGGAGKTQIALQFAYDVKQTRPEYSIFWISALSKGSFHQSCMEITTMLHIQDDKENPKVSLHRYLKSKDAGKCLIIVDNADDVDLLHGFSRKHRGLYGYLPNTQHGRILFTTRSKDLARRNPQREVLEIDQMEAKEAVQLLYKLSVPKKLLREEKQTMELLDELKYLPLAISQAAAYLVRNDISIETYLGLIRSEEKTMVDLMNRALKDDTIHEEAQRAVATTWLVTFEQIRKTDANAAAVLEFLSFIEPKAIPESLLEGFHKLDKKKLVEAIGTLSCYSFVKRREDGKLLDMHSLVHLAARVWLKESGKAEAAIESALKQVYVKFPGTRWETRMIQRDYLPHALKITQDDMTKQMETRYDLIHAVGQSLYQEGRYAESVISGEDTLRWREQHLGEDHFKLLDSLYHLGIAYAQNGQVKDAISLLERAVEMASKTRAEDNLSQLRYQMELAAAYNKNNQTKDAIQMLERVVKIRSSKLAEDGVVRLSAQRKLANAYMKNGQIKEAMRLLERIVEIRSRTLAKDHPSRLTAQHDLAQVYAEQGQVKVAIRRLEQIVEIKSITLAENHPDLLVSQHSLAIACLGNGEEERAVELLEHVVAVGRRTFADRDRLNIEEHLSKAREQLQRSQDRARRKSIVGFPWRRRKG
ncbi:acyl transferase/acyl hydrolase/lysophospholipase [Pestalotiopsis sp. NC0098]|nr:acyl transferase/acyl hydrolase/lysophospholipase [Pestalotiopsis sp. NC0098]